MEHEVDSHGTAEHLCQIAGADGEFAEQPVGPASPARVPVAAALGEVLAGDHAQTGGDDLHEDGHQAGEADYPEESIFELRAARQIGAPVARVHVADADENGRSDEHPPLLPEAGLMMRHVHAAMHSFERYGAGV